MRIEKHKIENEILGLTSSSIKQKHFLSAADEEAIWDEVLARVPYTPRQLFDPVELHSWDKELHEQTKTEDDFEDAKYSKRITKRLTAAAGGNKSELTPLSNADVTTLLQRVANDKIVQEHKRNWKLFQFAKTRALRLSAKDLQDCTEG